MQTSQIILDQLGANKFLAMTGAKNLVAINNGLQFKLPARFAKDGINSVRITLNADDLYDVEYGKVRGLDYKVISNSEGVYCDGLRSDFKEQTGLDTSL